MMLGIVEVTTDNREEESGTVNFYNHRDNDGAFVFVPIQRAIVNGERFEFLLVL